MGSTRTKFALQIHRSSASLTASTTSPCPPWSANGPVRTQPSPYPSTVPPSKGAYDLNTFSGIVFLPHRPWQASKELLPGAANKNGEGEMGFGHGCGRERFFFGEGKYRRLNSCAGRYCFKGVTRPEGGTAARTARSMRVEWEAYNKQAYEEERRARWS